MIKALISDFSRVLLFPVDSDYAGGLNKLHRKISKKSNYNFWLYFRLNRELLEYYQSLKGDVLLYVFTSEHIQNDPAVRPELKRVFHKVFSATRLGLKKTDPRSYTLIATKLGMKPKEIIYVDDKSANIDAAKEAGMKTALYTGNASLKQTITDILN